MENYASLFMAFASGFCFHILWSYLVSMGAGMIVFKSSMKDALIMLAHNIQSVHEINYIKESAWRLTERDEKYINFQKMVDTKEMNSLRNTAIRNFINSVPPRYNYLVEFHDWNSAMDYVDKIIKEGK